MSSQPGGSSSVASTLSKRNCRRLRRTSPGISLATSQSPGNTAPGRNRIGQLANETHSAEARHEEVGATMDGDRVLQRINENRWMAFDSHAVAAATGVTDQRIPIIAECEDVAVVEPLRLN